ncbi:hypothetical protein QR680_014041 [Steinernema hermaphroditum]|uniref:Pre-mRNA-splicing factor SPF27 n=1 Tax=Steinernema hermaphroditum TaxID=289476 RepID=A0AA39M3I8_9BILA|nr:hypothetical protein QR680_014041 [Steinernema hermaphroditum]
MNQNTPMLALEAGGPPTDAEHPIDALPYLDTEYTENDQQYALALIEQECRVFRPTKNYLRHLPVPDYDAFLTPRLQEEMERMAKKVPMPQLDLSRCDLPCPSTVGKGADKNSWRKAIANAKAQNQHLNLRTLNLALLEEFGPEWHRRHNKDLEDQLNYEEELVKELRKEIHNVHASRKRQQEEAGRKITHLDKQWVQGVSKNYQLAKACVELESENEELAKRLRVDLSEFTEA